MTKQFEQVGNEIWRYDGSAVRFYGFPYPTRMIVIKLSNGDLWVHSPTKANKDLKQELADLGKVKHLVAPNKLHHLFLPEWIHAYPDAITYAAPGLANKRKDIQFNMALSDKPEASWADEIDQTIFKGSPAMEEVIFFHKPSSTLILTDLIENFNPDTLNQWQAMLAWFAGILSPNGKTPLDWRLTFFFGSKKQAIASLDQLLAWKPDNVVMSHGECIIGGGVEFLLSSFNWLHKA